MALTFRDSLLKLVPPWLQRGVAAKILRTIGQQFDDLALRAAASIKIRFPGFYSDDSLPLLSRERRIRRGPNESAERFAARLTRWLDDHRGRGGPYALLAQLYAYYGEAPFPVRLIYRSGRYFDLDVDGTVTMGDSPGWSPDDEPERWAQWRLLYEWPTPVPAVHEFGDVGLTFGSGATFGSGLTVSEVYDLRIVPREWNAAHAIGSITLVNGAAIFGFPPRLFGEPGLVFGGSAPVTLGVS